MDESRINDIITKSIAGKATPEELSLLDKWYDSFEAKEGLTDKMDASEKSATSARMLERIRGTILPSKPEKVQKVPAISRYRSLMIAASLIILLGLGLLVYNLVSRPGETSRIVYVNITGKEKQTTKTTLPDGSIIWLNGESKIRYDNNFIKDTRVVWLDGEAYFSVVSQQKKPFIVHAGKLNVSVVGTEFNIRMHKSDPTTVVTVTKGKVAVDIDQEVLGVLGMNEEIVYNSNGGARTAAKKVNPDQAIAWKTGSLIFRETSFKNIAGQLKSKFDMDIIFKDPGIEKCLLTASFDSNVSPVEIIKMLSSINGSKVIKQNGRYVISGKPCK
ncbi:FecR family protein [Flavitalea sp.]|nr:FecR domain-containing protein [Flavitalea sp.]